LQFVAKTYWDPFGVKKQSPKNSPYLVTLLASQLRKHLVDLDEKSARPKK
jgi:hypothetical protein